MSLTCVAHLRYINLMTTRTTKAPESPILHDEADDMAVTNRTPETRALTQDSAQFEAMKTATFQKVYDPLNSTVIMQSPVGQTLELNVRDVLNTALPFHSGPAMMATTAPATNPSVPKPPSGEFSGTMVLSIAALLQGEAQPTLPFGQSAMPASPPVPAPVSPPIATLPTPAPEVKTIGQTVFTSGYPQTANAPVEYNAARLDTPATMDTFEVNRHNIVMLYLHRPSMPRIVRKPVWQPILEELDDVPMDPDADDPALSQDPAEIQEQMEAYAILRRGRSIAREDASKALDKAANKAGRFAPPIELFEGSLEPTPDEIETLRAFTALIPAYIKQPERMLEDALAAANVFLQNATAAFTAPLIRRHVQDLRQAYGTSKTIVPWDEVNALVVRALSERRQYQKQQFLGVEHLRASLYLFGQTTPEVVFIPLEVVQFLPLTPEFPARILAEIHFAQDPQGSNAMVLRCLALGHVIRRNST